MTKEEILRKATSGIACAYYDGVEYDGESGSIEEAMDEYAKQEAMAFAEWADNNGWWREDYNNHDGTSE